jgi:hypothetical protein
MSGVYRRWDNHKINGWIFETPESLKEVFIAQSSPDALKSTLESYESEFEKTMSPLFFDTQLKLNLGGENDKARLEFTDKPQGIFDFSLASNSLYRVAEYFCQEIYDSKLLFFEGFDLPKGVVPNNFVQTRQVGNGKEFFYEDKNDNKIYICEQRQKGLTEALKKDPTLPLSKQGTMTISTKFSPLVKFSSRTKKPYIRYKKRGGKVKYVEIYSLNYYSRMTGNFFMAVRHLPAVMVLDYLEKQGTSCKFYITRFVEQGGNDYIREFDITTNATLPLFECAKYSWKKLVLIPKCVKDYGEAIDYSFIFGVGSDNASMYEAIYRETMEREFDPNDNTYAYGEPRWQQYEYEEGFERFRQKFLEYSKRGIWKAKEVKPQGLILYHDYNLNVYFKGEMQQLNSILKNNNLIDFAKSNPQLDDYTRCLMGNNNALKWFETYMKVCAFIIKHRLDVYNTNNMSKTYREIENEINNIKDEVDLLIRGESNQEAKEFYEDFLLNINNRYLYKDVKAYCLARVEEMTNYAEGGCFETPTEQQKERDEEAKRLRDEIKKV